MDLENEDFLSSLQGIPVANKVVCDDENGLDKEEKDYVELSKPTFCDNIIITKLKSNDKTYSSTNHRKDDKYIDDEKALSKILRVENSVSPGDFPTGVIHTCEICDKTFKYFHLLKRHNTTHFIKRWECEVCHQKLDNRSNLRKHMLIHSDEKPYMCMVCHKSFRVSTGLTRHMRTHSGEQPYECSFCKKNFLDVGNLRKHERRMHSATSSNKKTPKKDLSKKQEIGKKTVEPKNELKGNEISNNDRCEENVQNNRSLRCQKKTVINNNEEEIDDIIKNSKDRRRKVKEKLKNILFDDSPDNGQRVLRGRKRTAEESDISSDKTKRIKGPGSVSPSDKLKRNKEQQDIDADKALQIDNTINLTKLDNSSGANKKQQALREKATVEGEIKDKISSDVYKINGLCDPDSKTTTTDFSPIRQESKRLKIDNSHTCDPKDDMTNKHPTEECEPVMNPDSSWTKDPVMNKNDIGISKSSKKKYVRNRAPKKIEPVTESIEFIKTSPLKNKNDRYILETGNCKNISIKSFFANKETEPEQHSQDENENVISSKIMLTYKFRRKELQIF